MTPQEYDRMRFKLGTKLLLHFERQGGNWNEKAIWDEVDAFLAAGGYTREAAPIQVEPTDDEWASASLVSCHSSARTWELHKRASREAYRLASERVKGDPND